MYDFYSWNQKVRTFDNLIVIKKDIFVSTVYRIVSKYGFSLLRCQNQTRCPKVTKFFVRVLFYKDKSTKQYERFVF